MRATWVIVVTGLAAACSTSSSGSPPTATGTPTPTVTATATATKTVTPPNPAEPSTFLCAPSNSRTHDYGGQGAAGTEFTELVVTNISTHPCRTGGYPGFALLNSHGHVMRTRVSRDSERAGDAVPGQPKFFMVRPGGDFYVEFSWSAAGSGCNDNIPPSASSLRITLPDNRAYTTVSLHGSEVDACRGRLNAYPVFKQAAH